MFLQRNEAYLEGRWAAMQRCNSLRSGCLQRGCRRHYCKELPDQWCTCASTQVSHHNRAGYRGSIRIASHVNPTSRGALCTCHARRGLAGWADVHRSNIIARCPGMLNLRAQLIQQRRLWHGCGGTLRSGHPFCRLA